MTTQSKPIADRGESRAHISITVPWSAIDPDGDGRIGVSVELHVSLYAEGHADVEIDGVYHQGLGGASNGKRAMSAEDFQERLGIGVDALLRDAPAIAARELEKLLEAHGRLPAQEVAA